MTAKRLFIFLGIFIFLILSLAGCSSSGGGTESPATYSVSGTVTHSAITVVGAKVAPGVPFAGVKIYLTGDATVNTTTDASGKYSFSGLAVGNYTVTPVKTGYTFDQLCGGGHLTADVTDANFTGTVNPGLTYSISGAVSGDVADGVEINLTGDATGTTVTAGGGKYSFSGILLNGNYTVTPNLHEGGYTFSPTGTGVNVSGADVTGINFTAAANVLTKYSISGTVSGAVAAGVTITLSGSGIGTAITTTDGSGAYSFAGLLPGGYTVTPSRTGYTFSPASLTPTVVAANIPGQDFTATNVSATHSISGAVSGAVTNGVAIYLTGTATANTTTAGGGLFSFTSLANGAYTVTPVLAGYTFAPSSLAVTVSGGNITGANFVASVPPPGLTWRISGAVSGDVKSGVTITLSGAGSGTTTTNGSGNYSFSGLANGSYTVTPYLALPADDLAVNAPELSLGYTFVPAYHTVIVSGADVPDQNFTVGTPPATWSQADLTGTWRINVLERGKDGAGNPKNKWMRGRFSMNSAGVATCLSMSDSGGASTCPGGFDLTLTMNTTTGVITQTGANAVGDHGHMTMTTNKNFAAGTGTNGTTPNFSYQLFIVQKEETGTSYSAADVQSKSLAQHNLSVGNNNTWDYWTGTTDASGMLTISSETTPYGTTAPGATGMTASVDSNGIVTLSGGDMDSYQGFLSADKKTIVATHTHGSGPYSYNLDIVQVTGTEFTVGPFAPGIAAAHMLGTGTGVAFWIHDTITVAPGGGMTFSDWVASYSPSSAPTGYTGNVTTTSGTLTITGNPTYHGQVSHDGKFTVGTQTPATDRYVLSVSTK